MSDCNIFVVELYVKTVISYDPFMKPGPGSLTSAIFHIQLLHKTYHQWQLLILNEAIWL